MKEFSQIVQIIHSARNRALSFVNSELVNLYWQVGQYVSMRLEKATWGDNTVSELAQYIQKHHPEVKGFDKKNHYRMCQFYQTYCNALFVAPLVRQIQVPVNEDDKIIAPVVPPLGEDFGLNMLSDIRNTLLVQISWSQHLVILGRCKLSEEREFYLKLSIP